MDKLITSVQSYTDPICHWLGRHEFITMSICFGIVGGILYLVMNRGYEVS